MPDRPTVQATTNYDKFSMLIANRATTRAHILALKEALQEHPEILEAQPILVNEKFQIIDGQHRFIAASELGMPIYYTQVTGIGIETARMMNVLQRRWEPTDFAKSYAISGSKDYIQYLKALEDFGLPHNVTMSALSQTRAKGLNARFRKGEFKIENEEMGRLWLERITEVRKHSSIPMISPFMFALLQVFAHPDFKYDRFVEKLKSNGANYLRRSPIMEDYLRMIEEIYNVGKQNRVRLF